MKQTTTRAAVALMMASAGIPSAQADDLPLWELGIGLGFLSVPDYRGSDESHNYVLPVPYFVYRGDVVKADRSGARIEFLDTDRLKLNLSLNASTPTDSKHNDARQGMSNLKPTIEIGPNLNYTVFETANRNIKVDLRLPVRAAITVQTSPKSIGFVSTPNVDVDFKNLVGGWNLGMLTGPVFGTQHYHDYFYTVPGRDATAERPEYHASGGYSGAQATLGLSRRFSNVWVGAFVRYDNLTGARFDDSPLVVRNHDFAVGIAASWIFGESDRRVHVDD